MKPVREVITCNPPFGCNERDCRHVFDGCVVQFLHSGREREEFHVCHPLQLRIPRDIQIQFGSVDRAVRGNVSGAVS
jgi:hypothetical protein